MELVPVRLLADVFETFAPMTREESTRRAELATETLAATRSRSERLQLGLALRSLELAPLTALAGGELARFSRSSPAARERRPPCVEQLPHPATAHGLPGLEATRVVPGVRRPGSRFDAAREPRLGPDRIPTA